MKSRSVVGGGFCLNKFTGFYVKIVVLFHEMLQVYLDILLFSFTLFDTKYKSMKFVLKKIYEMKFLCLFHLQNLKF